MPRKRDLGPGFFRNEILAECDPLARILFEGLWCWADRNGILEDRPRRLKADILPYDDCDIEQLMDQLEKRDFISRVETEGTQVIVVVNFEKHQRVHPKEEARFEEPKAAIKRGRTTAKRGQVMASCALPSLPSSPSLPSLPSSPTSPSSKRHSVAPGASLEAWREDLGEKSEGTDLKYVTKYLDAAVKACGEYYDRNGGKLTEMRIATIARRMGKCSFDAQMGAIEIYCDAHSGVKDFRYMCSIAERLNRASPKELDRDIEKHRIRMNGCGLVKGA